MQPDLLNVGQHVEREMVVVEIPYFSWKRPGVGGKVLLFEFQGGHEDVY